MNLHEIAPEYFLDNEFVTIDLDKIYKHHSANSHQTALEIIFAEGVKNAIQNIKDSNDEEKKRHHAEMETLRREFHDLEWKHEKLLSQNGVVQETKSDREVTNEALKQVMGMGKTLR